MSLSIEEITAWVGTFIWPFMRISAMLIALPVLSARTLPVRIRLLLALVLTWIVSLTIPPAPAIEPLSVTALEVVVQQFLIGLGMAFILQVVFDAVAFAGQVIAYSMGLGFASMVDPSNGAQVPIVGQYLIIITTLVFLMFDGHLVFLALLMDSFQTIPVGPMGLFSADLWSLVQWGGRLFAGGLLMALPAVVSLLLVNLTFGVITRAAPQLNIFAVGFPVTILLGFWILWTALPHLTDHFVELLNEAMQRVRELVRYGG